MTLHVDDARKRLRLPSFPNIVASHLWADSLDELLAAADRLCLERRHLQGPTKLGRHFFYVSQRMRRQIIAAGAQEVAS